MPTELEELVDFISHGNTQIRQLAVENLVPFSLSQPAIFKTYQLLPIKDLKLLVRDYEQIAKDAITILINLSTDREILENLATDKEFFGTILGRITNPKEPNANLLCMLLANLAKHDSMNNILTITRPAPESLKSNDLAINQLVDLFVKGADGTYNPKADFDYLSYLFADLANHAAGRTYFLSTQDYDGIVPLTKLIVFTEHASDIRRKGVASTIKNTAFEISSHPTYFFSDDIDLLPYLLLPLTGAEEYADDELEGMLPDLQLLPPDKARDADPRILETHVETLTLLSTTREGREALRGAGVYYVVRETHLRVEDEGVREACDRLVQTLMRGEEGEEEAVVPSLSEGEMKALEGADGNGKVEEVEDDEEDDDQIVEV